ncbi:MAG: hypothetical protein HUK22_00075, partial [Thermoguttaceae bacterium]|nr:hypothetical protein [Thermoguttaceae bacterium]
MNARFARRLATFAILAAAVLFAPLFFGAADAKFTVDEPTLQAAIDRAKADLAELKTNLADGDDLLGLYIDYKTNPENYDQGSLADLKAGIAALLPARARVSSIELAVARGENKLKLMKAQKASGSSFGDPKEAKLEDIVFSPAEKAAFAKKNARVEKADLDEIARDVWGKELTGFAKVLDKLSLTANGVPFAMIYCEPGVVALKGRRETLTQGFYLAETETTQALWEAVTGKNPSILNKGANKPVENVSRDDCRDFIAKLNALGIAPAG